MKRVVLCLASLWLGVGCSTLQSLHGAKTLEPRKTQWATAMSLQRGGTPLSYAGIPIPQLEFAFRYGVAPDVDFGMRFFLVGVGADVRYRFFQSGDLHVAVDPGVTFVALAGQGSADFRAPVLFELELGKAASWMGGPQLMLRDTWNSIDDEELGKGSASRLDVFAGAGTRLELHGPSLFFAPSVDVFVQPARHGGVAWSAGFDLGFRPRPRDKRRAVGKTGNSNPR